jgi:hypothetical protein
MTMLYLRTSIEKEALYVAFENRCFENIRIDTEVSHTMVLPTVQSHKETQRNTRIDNIRTPNRSENIRTTQFWN